jgi:AraC family transcriptional regulator
MRDTTRSEYARCVDAVIRLVADSLDDVLPASIVAGVAGYSRFHFQRAFKGLMGESPGAFRRRLLLERAAWQLRDTPRRVTDIALDASYDSLEALTRAFRRAFGISPRAFRLVERTSYRLASRSGVHFHPGTRLSGSQHLEGWDIEMDLVDRLIGHDLWMTRRLLERARALSDIQLDQKVSPGDWALRDLLDKCVWNKENWVSVMRGQEETGEKDRSLSGMVRRLDAIAPEYAKLARGTRDAGTWDATFSDGLCTPPETFTFGGAFAHIITHSAHRRALVVDALRGFGVDGLDDLDPIDWERTTLVAIG